MTKNANAQLSLIKLHSAICSHDSYQDSLLRLRNFLKKAEPISLVRTQQKWGGCQLLDNNDDIAAWVSHSALHDLKHRFTDYTAPGFVIPKGRNYSQVDYLGKTIRSIIKELYPYGRIPEEPGKIVADITASAIETLELIDAPATIKAA